MKIRWLTLRCEVQQQKKRSKQWLPVGWSFVQSSLHLTNQQTPQVAFVPKTVFTLLSFWAAKSFQRQKLAAQTKRLLKVKPTEMMLKERTLRIFMTTTKLHSKAEVQSEQKILPALHGYKIFTNFFKAMKTRGTSNTEQPP